MSFAVFFRKSLLQFFIISTAVTVATGLLGLGLAPEASFGYEAYFSPVLFGAIAVIPSIILFSIKELTFRQMLIRRILHFIALEFLLIGFGSVTGIIEGWDMVISFAFSVFVVYLFTNAVQYLIDSKTAVKINEGLKKLQS